MENMSENYNTDDLLPLLEKMLKEDPQFRSSIARVEKGFIEQEAQDDQDEVMEDETVLVVKIGETRSGAGKVSVMSVSKNPMEIIDLLSGIIQMIAHAEGHRRGEHEG